MTGLATLAALSERATVGTAVLLAPLYHPVIVARKQAAELDVLTGGRVAIGVGVGGEYPAEFRGCQVDPADRGRAQTRRSESCGPSGPVPRLTIPGKFCASRT